MLTRTMVAISAAFVLGAASVAPASAAQTKVRHRAPASAQQRVPAANAAQTPAVLPFTEDERREFDRASTVLGAGR